MAQFSFYQDSKIITWERNTFTVEAADYREAVEIIQSLKGNDLSIIDDPRLEIEESRVMVEFSTLIPPEENDGKATLFVYDDNDAEVMNNRL